MVPISAIPTSNSKPESPDKKASEKGAYHQNITASSHLPAALKRPKFIRRFMDLLHIFGQYNSNGSYYDCPDLVVPDAACNVRSEISSTQLPKAPDNKSPSRLGWRIFNPFTEKHESISREKGHSTSAHHSLLHFHEHCDNISDSEVESVKCQIAEIDNVSELCFERKYKFTCGKVIGKGASGTVRLGFPLCDSPESPSRVAIKEFRPQRKSETREAYVRKLLAEYTIAHSLRNDHVVNTIDIVQDGSKWYEVMEYCSQGDLFHFIHHGGLKDVDTIESCLKQLVLGVAYLHSQGVAHRDLKPENLLVDGHGCLKIADFGVSDVFITNEDGTVSRSQGICGSSPYIAPEEYSNKPYDARKADTWSIGIIYYAMIFHGIPWESATEKDSNYRLFISHGAGCFEPFTRLQHGPRCLLRRMLEPDPEKRISVEEIVGNPWFKSIPVIPLLLHKDD